MTRIKEANRFFVRGPIESKELFVGRKKELSEALVMCQQVVAGATGGILVYGGRGVGKTSFVDALRRELNSRAIPNSELIGLDDSWAEKGKEYLFFKTILSEMIKTAYQFKLLEESIGKKLVNAITDRIGLEEIQLQFPAITVVAKKGPGDLGEQFPSIYFRDGIRELLGKIRAKKAPAGLFLCIDEGDVLTANRTLLQVLRNVFQHTPGTGIVLAGTYSLLEQVNDVFSPIPRFFQKIELGAFSSFDELNHAIDIPLELSKKVLRDQDTGVTFEKRNHGGESFVTSIERISERMPLDVNMLCHYALQVGAKRGIRYGQAIIVPLMIDYEVMRNAISQLKGTRNYADFIASLEPTEITFMEMLAQSDRKITPDELTLLIHLDDLGKNLQTAPIQDIMIQIKGFRNYRQIIDGLLTTIGSKAKEHNVRALGLGATGKAGITIEDQWVRANFKFSVPKIWNNLERSSTVDYEGIRMFGDPISSIIHSVFFPRLRHAISGKAEFRAHTDFGQGDNIPIEKGRKLLRVTYRRTADGNNYHIAFQVRNGEDMGEWLESIPLFLQTLKAQGFVNLYNCDIKQLRYTR